jgi:hypothetical protein
MLAWPEDKRKGGGSRSGGNNGRKGKRRNRKLPETWHYNQQVEYFISFYYLTKTQTNFPSKLESKDIQQVSRYLTKKRDSTRPFSFLSDRTISLVSFFVVVIVVGLLFHQLSLLPLKGTILSAI